VRVVTYLQSRTGTAVVLKERRDPKRGQEVYISFVGDDKRLDNWVGADVVGTEVSPSGPDAGQPLPLKDSTVRLPAVGLGVADASENKLGEQGNGLTGRSVSRRLVEPSPSVQSAPDREHATMTRVRNFEDVRFGEYLIKTWWARHCLGRSID